MSDAGEGSPHLDKGEQRQAAERAPPGPLVIHEIVREQGEAELERPSSSLAWSGLAAGLSIGFSFMLQAVLQARLPDAPWQLLISAFGYSLGFLIVILGRQQLFTETTLTALIPSLTHPSLGTWLGTLRVWAIVLTANLVGTAVFGAVSAWSGVFTPDTLAAMQEIAHHAIGNPFWHTVFAGGSAGWLIGLMVWLLPGAGPARPMIIVLLTYTIAACQFPHIIAGSVEAVFLVAAGAATAEDYLTRFFIPTLIGNVAGGTILAALLNHAPVRQELAGGGKGDDPAA
jgi:formate/nitrite transporter FocA (FNT family)